MKKAKQLVVKTIKKDDVENLRKIFNSGLQVDEVVKMPGMTPLMVCASEGSLSSLEVLLEFEPDINITDMVGRTALHYACKAANIKVARALMEHDDADVDI